MHNYRNDRNDRRTLTSLCVPAFMYSHTYTFYGDFPGEWDLYELILDQHGETDQSAVIMEGLFRFVFAYTVLGRLKFSASLQRKLPEKKFNYLSSHERN